jgi:hypothetical protein
MILAEITTAQPDALQVFLASFMGDARAAEFIAKMEASIAARVKARTQPLIPYAVGAGVLVVTSIILSGVAIARSRK